MIYRILSVAIISFWLVMTSLLIHLENHPDQSDLLDVPTAHVLKIMFAHQQISDLTITQADGHALGNFMIHPKVNPATGAHSLLFSGGFSFTPPGSQKKQRLTWDGELFLDHAYNNTGLDVAASLQDAPYHIRLHFDPEKKQVTYELIMNGRTFKRATVPLTQEGVAGVVREELGIDPMLMQSMPMSLNGISGGVGMGAPVISSKQTELKIHKENVVAYLITIKTGETTAAEIYVSQLGQVLTAKTFLGYNLTTEDITPP